MSACGCTRWLCGALVEQVRRGAPPALACDVIGLRRATFYRWMRWGRARREPFASFRNEVVRAEAEVEVARITRIAEVAETDWTAAAWLLERRWSSRWMRRRELRVRVVEFRLPHNPDALSQDEARAYEAALEKMNAPRAPRAA